MKKIISALLICMLAAVCLFTGCSKAKGLKVKDSSGNDRVLVTDENGKPVYDEAGNIVVVDTDEKGNAKKDENGEQATNAIALDYLLVSGKNAYCRYFTFTQPSGYDMSAVGSAITLTKGDETIDIIYDTEKSVDDKSADIGEVIASIKEQGYNPTQIAVKLNISKDTAKRYIRAENAKRGNSDTPDLADDEKPGVYLA